LIGEKEELGVRKMYALSVAIMIMLTTGYVQAAESNSSGKLVLGLDQPHSIGPSTTKGPYYHQSEAEQRCRKMFRGFANIFFSIAEIPNQMFREAYSTSPVCGATVGAFKGVGKGAQRIVVGLIEVVTFFHPLGKNYEPIIEPEVVFMDENH
jgi:putative exosortase-associated protein (TIGR04073 family)